MTVPGFGVLLHRAFEVRAAQVIEQHFEFRLKQIGQLLAQPQEQFRLMFQHPIQTAIQAIFLGHGEVRSQQCIHGGGSDTTGDAPETRCRDPAADSPPTDAKLFPKRRWPAYTIAWLPRDRFGLTAAPRNLSSAGSNATSPLCSATHSLGLQLAPAA